MMHPRSRAAAPPPPPLGPRATLSWPRHCPHPARPRPWHLCEWVGKGKGWVGGLQEEEDAST